MVNEITKTVAAYKLLASPKNILILNALKKNPSKAKDLEKVVNLDRMSIKRRLYKLVAVGLVKEEKVKSKRTIAILYKVILNRRLPNFNLSQILDHIEEGKLTEITRL